MVLRAARRRNEQGNILFLILLAIVLFVALTYAVNSGMRGGGNDASNETIKAGTAQIMGFFTQLDAVTLRMQMAGNVPIQNISYEYVTIASNGNSFNNYINSNCTSDTCRVFKPSGGGASPVTFQKYATVNPTGWDSSWPTPGHFDFYMMQWPYAGTDLNDIVLRISGMDPAICVEINQSQGITTVPTLTGSSNTAYVTSNWDSTAYTCTANCSLLAGKHSFAYGTMTRGSGNFCTIYHLLIAR